MSEMKIMHEYSLNQLVDHTLVQKFYSNNLSADSRAYCSVRLFLNHGVQCIKSHYFNPFIKKKISMVPLRAYLLTWNYVLETFCI